MMLHTKYQGSRPSGFGQEDFLSFHLKSIFSLYDLDMQRTRGPTKDHLCDIIS